MEHNPTELADALLSFLRGRPAEVHDWHGFRVLALQHGILGLVYPVIDCPEARSTLFPDYSSQASNTLAHMAIMSFLREVAPDFLPMKGASLIARGLYLPQERPLLDIDILVRPRDISSFVRILSGEGFSEVISSPKSVVMHRGRINVDLHAHPVARELFIPPGKLWNRSSEGFLSPEDELIIIAAHAALSSFTFGPRLIWRIDAERILPIVDLGKAFALARAIGIESCLARFFLARDQDILRGRRRPGRLRKLWVSCRAGANKAQRALCIFAAGWERVKNG
ncbi:MAG: nucleotidyltransferase family protein [candidate division WOR-3 bacterium]